MLLEIKDINQNSFKIAVKLSDTIMQVKEKIESKIEILDVDDQKLVYSGNILANDSTVKQCDFEPNDYVTLIYNSTKKDKVREIIEKERIDSKLEENIDSGQMSRDASSNTSTFTDDNSNIFEDSRNTSEELITNADKFIDLESDDLSRYALLKFIPNVKKLCKQIRNNPVDLPKMFSKMSRKSPLVFEKILENQHAYIDLLNTDEHSDVDKAIKKLEIKDHEAIDRFTKKGYEKEMMLEVYQACDLNEKVVDEFINYLH